jgi:hypothetical protein
MHQLNPQEETAKAADGPKCLYGPKAEKLGDYALTPVVRLRKRGEEYEVYDL